MVQVETKVKHEWKYFPRWKFIACENCGILWSEFNKNAMSCKGVVKVGLRKKELSHALQS